MGNNMFAYCNNNPLIFKDVSGTSAVAALVVTAVVGAVVGAIGSLIAGDSAGEVIASALWGAFEGAAIFVCPESVILFAGYNGFTTLADCANSGADMSLSITAGVLTGLATFGLPGTGDDYADMAVAGTFGAAESILVDGVTQGIQNTGERASGSTNYHTNYRAYSGGGAAIVGKPISRTSIIR